MNKTSFNFKKFLNKFKNVDFNQTNNLKKINLNWNNVNNYSKNNYDKILKKNQNIVNKTKIRKIILSKNKKIDYDLIIKDFNSILNFSNKNRNNSMINFNKKRKKNLKSNQFHIKQKKFNNNYFIDKDYHSINKKKHNSIKFKIKNKINFILNK